MIFLNVKYLFILQSVFIFESIHLKFFKNAINLDPIELIRLLLKDN